VKTRRGRPASFASTGEPTGNPVHQLGSLVFVHIDERGQRTKVDLTNTPPPRLARTLVGSIARDVEFDGRCRSAGSVTTRATAARRFLAELNRAGIGDVEPDELGPEHLECFEQAIDGTLHEASAWKTVTLVCGLLRTAVEAGLLRPSDALEQRLRYNTLRFEYRNHPLAYPTTVVDQLRFAAWKDLLAARKRRQRGERMLAGDDDGSPALAGLVPAIHSHGGYLSLDETIGLHLRGAWDKTGDANRHLHLTADEVVAGLVLVGLKPGSNPSR
jgi:hypothetical protein